MDEIIKLKARKFGDALGLIIPDEISKEMGIRENEEIEVTLSKNNPLKETFGMLKGKIKESSQEMKDRLRNDLYDDY